MSIAVAAPPEHLLDFSHVGTAISPMPSAQEIPTQSGRRFQLTPAQRETCDVFTDVAVFVLDMIAEACIALGCITYGVLVMLTFLATQETSTDAMITLPNAHHVSVSPTAPYWLALTCEIAFAVIGCGYVFCQWSRGPRIEQ